MGLLAFLVFVALSGCAEQQAGDTDRTTEPTAARAAVQEAGTAADVVDVVAVGDIACAPGEVPASVTCRQQETADLAKSLQPDAVLALGDLQYETGSLSAFQASYDASWGAMKSFTFPVPGNHEYRTKGARGYYGYFDGQPGGAAPGYYTVQLGAWRAYLLNTNCAQVDCAAERAWLRTDLATQPVECTLFAMHHPRFSSGEHGSQVFTRPFMRIGFRNGLDLALGGHDHHYERFGRMDPDGQRDTSHGFFQFVSGAGGKSHYDAVPPIAGSLFRNDTAFGVLHLRLSPGRFRFAFKSIAGSTPDSGVRYCK